LTNERRINLISHQQQKFKKDPSKFGRNLFEKKSVETQSFQLVRLMSTFVKTIVMRRERDPSLAIARNEAPARTKNSFSQRTVQIQRKFWVLSKKKEGQWFLPRS
jgi:hypothetical protein